MPSNILPTLSNSGWVSAISEKADKLLAYFFVADGSQSALYKNKTYSLPNIVKDFNGNGYDITSKVQDELSKYLYNYFDTVDVQATHETTDNKINIKIYVKITEKGKEYSLGKLVVLADNNISKIISMNN